jgi:hypothetical protein
MELVVCFFAYEKYRQRVNDLPLFENFCIVDEVPKKNNSLSVLENVEIFVRCFVQLFRAFFHKSFSFHE